MRVVENVHIYFLHCVFPFLVTYMILKRTPIPLVISMIVASISYSLVISLSTAIYTNIPVTTQMSKTDTVAPMTSARCQPKFIDVDEGLEATYSENRDIIKEAKSVNKCAASVAIAKLLARIPPTISKIMKNRHKTLAKINLFLAVVSIPSPRSV